jgi:hypothetical protein
MKLAVLLLVAACIGFLLGRRRSSTRQNRGEAAVRNAIQSNFTSPDYHLLNNVTLRLEDGTTQIDHILPSSVFTLREFIGHLREQTSELLSENRVQFSVGRLETARLAITRQTDVEHVRDLQRRHGQ